MTALMLFSILIPILGCVQPRRTAEALFLYQSDENPKYELTSPDAKYLLPYVLEEISGLSYVSQGILACIQDEEGKIFFYDHQKRKIIWQQRFGSSGDYEGVEIVKNIAFVVNSKGDIYSFQCGDEFEMNEVQKLKTELHKNNDIEGLGYDPEENALIIACKGDAGLKNQKMKGRGFYTFDLDSSNFVKDPIFNIRKKDIKAFLEKHKDFEYEENRINFRPSGIALHPNSGLYYIIASTGKLMLIVDKQGSIQGSIPIDPRLLGQPEGICFAPNGDLFISSEGQGDKGYILKFQMR